MAQTAAADGVQCNARRDDRKGHRQQGDRNAVGHSDGQTEGQHAYEMHRPDTGPHSDGTADEPVAGRWGLARC